MACLQRIKYCSDARELSCAKEEWDDAQLPRHAMAPWPLCCYLSGRGLRHSILRRTMGDDGTLKSYDWSTNAECMLHLGTIAQVQPAHVLPAWILAFYGC
jgi:hypothetical protein